MVKGRPGISKIRTINIAIIIAKNIASTGVRGSMVNPFLIR